MNIEYITIKEAVTLSGKSQSTIQRLCNSLEGTYHVKRHEGKYLIDKNYLLSDSKEDTKKTDNQNVNHDYSLTIQILQNELVAKNQQISELLERLRETNAINMNFQKQLKSPAFSQAIEKRTFLQNLKALFIEEN